MLTAVIAALGAAAIASSDDDPPPCFDAVVVARARKVEPTPMPDPGPGYIILSWPWRLQLEIDQRVAGPVSGSQVTAMMTLHSGLSHRGEDRLFFLRRNARHGWTVVDVDYRIVDDARRGFVRPMSGAADDDEISPARFLPVDYRRRLRPIDFDPGRAWWQADEADGGGAELGLPVDAWIDGLKDRRCPTLPASRR